MKGFEITVNKKEKITAAVYAGVVLITLSSNDGIDINGEDEELGVSLQWKQANLHFGDKIEIMATEIEVVSSVVERDDIDRQHMLAAYQNLKEFLIKEGRLK